MNDQSQYIIVQLIKLMKIKLYHFSALEYLSVIYNAKIKRSKVIHIIRNYTVGKLV